MLNPRKRRRLLLSNQSTSGINPIVSGRGTVVIFQRYFVNNEIAIISYSYRYRIIKGGPKYGRPISKIANDWVLPLACS